MKFYRTTSVLAALAAIAGIATATTDALALSRAEIKQIVITEAMNSPVPPSLALAVAKIESDFNARALSTAGARGVMQILPATARDVFGVHKDELWHPRLNIQLGIDYLAKLHRQYGGRWDLALSHYNGGSLRSSSRNAAAHPYTRKYVQMVLKWRQRYREQRQVWMAVAKANQKSEGWQAARTRPSNVWPSNRRPARIADALPRNDYFEDNRPLRHRSPWRVYYRHNLPAVLGPNDGRRGRWHRDYRARTITVDSWSGLFERRARERDRLDNFTPRRSWHNG